MKQLAYVWRKGVQAPTKFILDDEDQAKSLRNDFHDNCVDSSRPAWQSNNGRIVIDLNDVSAIATGPQVDEEG
jgi:hypothetical protein